MKLATDDRRKIDEVCDRLLSQALSTEEINKDLCVETVKKAYAFLGIKTPEILVFPSPTAAMAHVQTFCPDPKPAPRPVPDMTKEVTFADVWGMIAAAQPRVWPALGPEVDLSFHPEVMDALDTIPWDSEAWPPVKKRVQSKVFDLCHLAHTVTEALEDQIQTEPEGWLLHSQAGASLWAEATEYAALEAAVELGYVASPPACFLIARELLGNCGGVYSFEKLCLICERPVEIRRAKQGRQVHTFLRWRDGASRQRVFE